MKILMLLAFLFSLLVKAHEGHSHLPVNQQAPHGGILQGTQNFVLEVVQEANQIKCYAYTKELQSIDLSEIKVDLNVTFSNKTKSIIALKSEDHFYSGAIDFKNSHRAELLFSIKYKKNNIKLKFQLEPQH